MDKSKRSFRKPKRSFRESKRALRESKRSFRKTKRSFRESKRSFREFKRYSRKPKRFFRPYKPCKFKRRRLPPIGPGDRIHYSNIILISRFISEQGKILKRRVTRLTLRQQRKITIAIKQARILSLLPFLNNEKLFARIRASKTPDPKNKNRKNRHKFTHNPKKGPQLPHPKKGLQPPQNSNRNPRSDRRFVRRGP